MGDHDLFEAFLSELPVDEIAAEYLMRIEFSVAGERHRVSGDGIKLFKANRPLGCYDVFYFLDRRKIIKAITLEYDWLRERVAALL